ncbi:hypothetical protein [Bradyrhizobium sp.]|uniref:hypothetical protein n=1 Tax=Bradyrhizobium sp. TaxID=376 RepID=UPI003C3EEEA4
MATITSTTLSSTSADRASGLKAFWRHFFATAFNPYRPELHYMRGPGPAWRAKYGAEATFRPRTL